LVWNIKKEKTMRLTGRLTGVQCNQLVRAKHVAVTTVAADIVGPSKVPRNVLIQNNDTAGILYLYLAHDLYRGLRFTSGGTTAIVVGDTVTGDVGGATGIVRGVTLDSGSWAGGDAVGVLIFDKDDIDGTFEAENLDVGTTANLAAITADAFRCDSIGDAENAHMSLRFTSGSGTALIVGATITGETGGATAVVRAIVIDSGSWAATNAAGVLSIDTIVGTFETETLKVGANLNLANITADAYPKGMFKVLPGGGSFELLGIRNAVSALGSASNENVATSEGR